MTQLQNLFGTYREERAERLRESKHEFKLYDRLIT